MPKRISKYQVLALLGNGQVRTDMGKSESVEGQDTLHTMDGPTSYLCSATPQYWKVLGEYLNV